MALHPMSPADAAWYQLDGPANRAMVTGALITREVLDFDAVKALFAQRMAEFDRFTQRVVRHGLLLPSLYWQDMDPFDIEPHVQHLAVAAPYDLSALRTLIADLASTPLDPSLPLWRVHLVDDVDGGSALVMRYHHCIGDGSAMMSLAQKLFGRASPVAARARPREPVHAASVAATEAPTTAAPSQGRSHLGQVLAEAVSLPVQLADQAATAVGGGAMLLSELLKFPDPPSPFKGNFGLRKQVAWSRPVALKQIKSIGASHSAKVNDVLVAAISGALRAYLKQRGIDVNHRSLRALVPVDLRRPEQWGQMGNAFGLVILDLPVDTAQAAKRLALSKARMDAMKHSAEPVAMQFLLDLFGRGPKAIEDLARDLFGSKASLVISNVVGPPTPISIAGVAIDQLMFWVPYPGRELGMGISVLSYCGMVTLAVITDAHLVPDPQAITDLFNAEFSAMLHATRAASAQAIAARRRSRHPAAEQPAGRAP